MNTTSLDLFRQFAKTTTVQENNRHGAVIYTRVSSREQVDNNSLEIQKRECLKFANQKDYTVVAEFGGTHESAQSDERKEFGQMIAFAKRKRVGAIIVYSLDRFSRSGDNAVWLTRQLRNSGISLLSVTQPLDTKNASGVMMQNILLLFAQHDNDQRRTKTISGMQERLRKGDWSGVAPIGYLNVTEGGIKKVIPDKLYSPLIRIAFELKLSGCYTDVEISDRLIAAGGVRLTSKKLSVVFSNPFYCGLMVHSVLSGEVLEGKHEPLVSREVFLKINKVRGEAHTGYKWDKERDPLPLRSFVRCHVCGTGYAGYLVKKKGLYYYKCNRKGCKCNKSAKAMHEQFMSVLKQFTVAPELMQPLKDYLMNAVHEQTKVQRELNADYERQLKDATGKLEKITERFALDEITPDVFNTYAPKYRREVARISTLMAESTVNLSNLEMCVNAYVQKAAKLPELWESGGYADKTLVQKLAFPDGIQYDHKNGHYRTRRINSVLVAICLFTGRSNNEKTGLVVEETTESGLVVPTGIEPVSKV